MVRTHILQHANCSEQIGSYERSQVRSPFPNLFFAKYNLLPIAENYYFRYFRCTVKITTNRWSDHRFIGLKFQYTIIKVKHIKLVKVSSFQINFMISWNDWVWWNIITKCIMKYWSKTTIEKYYISCNSNTKPTQFRGSWLFYTDSVLRCIPVRGECRVIRVQYSYNGRMDVVILLGFSAVLVTWTLPVWAWLTFCFVPLRQETNSSYDWELIIRSCSMRIGCIGWLNLGSLQKEIPVLA